MYTIPYRLLHYDSYHAELKEIVENPKNQFVVQCYPPIGFSACGFPIDHYSIGNGPREIVYMGGTHGNEIIGVDFLLHYMKNLALGNGVFSSFRPDLFRIHFFPLQNPEGFFTTTYGILQVSKDLDLERFCKDYYLKYRQANQMIAGVGVILQAFLDEEKTNCSIEQWKSDFWKKYYGQDITKEDFKQFLEERLEAIDEILLEQLWNKHIKNEIIQSPWEYQHPFELLNEECIPEISPQHKNLRNCLKVMFENYPFPKTMYANFCANAQGINLNENNEPYFQKVKKLVGENGRVSVAPIYGNFPKNIPGPFGMPSENMESFVYATENQAVLTFLEKNWEHIYAFINCHSTGGMLFFNPYYEQDGNEERDFSFYINNRLATEYLKGIQESFARVGVADSYKGMGYPTRVSGFGDVLRKMYPASFLLELSKAGGNPLGPYIHPNYELTMKVNMEASVNLWKTILELQDLYGKTYRKYYDGFGRVHYEEGIRKLKK